MKKKDFIIAAVIPILIGVLASILTKEGMMKFVSIRLFDKKNVSSSSLGS